MRKLIPLLCLLCASHGHARIVDRIVAIVDESVITVRTRRFSQIELARLGQVVDQKPAR